MWRTTSFVQLVTTGATYEHWSRFIVMSFLVSAALILSVTRLLDYTLGLIETRLEYLKTRLSTEKEEKQSNPAAQ